MDCFEQKAALLRFGKLGNLREVEVGACLFDVVRDQPVGGNDPIEPRELRLVLVAVVAGVLQHGEHLRRRFQFCRDGRIRQLGSDKLQAEKDYGQDPDDGGDGA